VTLASRTGAARLLATRGIARSRGWRTTPAATTSIRPAAPTILSRRCSAPPTRSRKAANLGSSAEARFRQALTGRWLYPRAPCRWDAAQSRARSPPV